MIGRRRLSFGRARRIPASVEGTSDWVRRADRFADLQFRTCTKLMKFLISRGIIGGLEISGLPAIKMASPEDIGEFPPFT